MINVEENIIQQFEMTEKCNERLPGKEQENKEGKPPYFK